mmetsp:Transcript_25079/g.41309  ORF Transcript_25079/g.41309 Transcript_25079/m.41309 type:complete len:223 (+) Transcript_25079:122-790(+)
MRPGMKPIRKKHSWRTSIYLACKSIWPARRASKLNSRLGHGVDRVPYVDLTRNDVKSSKSKYCIHVRQMEAWKGGMVSDPKNISLCRDRGPTPSNAFDKKIYLSGYLSIGFVTKMILLSDASSPVACLICMTWGFNHLCTSSSTVSSSYSAMLYPGAMMFSGAMLYLGAVLFLGVVNLVMLLGLGCVSSRALNAKSLETFCIDARTFIHMVMSIGGLVELVM